MSIESLKQQRDALLNPTQVPQLSTRCRQPTIPDVVLPSMQTFLDACKPKISDGYISVTESDERVKKAVVQALNKIEQKVPDGYVAINEVDELIKDAVTEMLNTQKVPDGYVAVTEVEGLIKEAANRLLKEKAKHLDNTRLTFMEVVYLASAEINQIWLTEKSQLDVADTATLAFIETSEGKAVMNTFVKFFKAMR